MLRLHDPGVDAKTKQGLDSRSYAQAAREATPLAETPYAWRERIEGFDQLKNEILQAVGICGEGE